VAPPEVGCCSALQSDRPTHAVGLPSGPVHEGKATGVGCHTLPPPIACPPPQAGAAHRFRSRLAPWQPAASYLHSIQRVVQALTVRHQWTPYLYDPVVLKCRDESRHGTQECVRHTAVQCVRIPANRRPASVFSNHSSTRSPGIAGEHHFSVPSGWRKRHGVCRNAESGRGAAIRAPAWLLG
jgi:hypothetical protein